MITGVLLVALMGLDTAFSGYRADAGRSGHIRVAGRRMRAMLQGGFLGWGAGTLLLGCLLTLGAVSPELVLIGQRLLLGYGLFAALIGAAFLARSIPSVDLRAASSVLVFGPLTLARPAVILAVATWAAWGASWPALLIVGIGVGLVLGIERILERQLLA